MKQKMRKWRSDCCRCLLYLLLGTWIGLILTFFLEDPSVCSWKVVMETAAEYDDVRQGDEMDDDKFLLFVGVMTARKFLDTRAKAINMTWAHRISGKVLFFIGEGEPYHGDLDVVELKGVSEDAYPPQKKSFAMLQYMNNHYAGRYKWLVRADDDVYIKADEFRRFLVGIDNTRYQYIGQPGFGRDAEKGRLGLVGPFCMGGPGVIMSAPLVRAVGPMLPSCLQDTMTLHEDTELGRCIAKTVGISCTQAYDMRHIMYQNYEELHVPESSFRKELGQSEVNAVTLHPVKEMSYAFRLENFINFYKLKKTEEKRYHLGLEMQAMDAFTNRSLSNADFLHFLGTDYAPPIPNIQRSAFSRFNLDQIKPLPKGNQHLHPDTFWDCITGNTIHSPKFVSAKMMFPVKLRARLIVKDNLTKTVTDYLRTHNPVKRPSSFFNFHYQRFSANNGILGYIVTKPEKFKDSKNHVRSFFYRSSFNQKIAFREATLVDEFYPPSKKKIVIIMTASKRSETYRRFMDMYAKIVVDYKSPLELRVTIFKDKENEHLNLTRITAKFRGDNPGLPVTTLYLEGDFNRGKGLMMATGGVSDNSLLLFMDMDLTFTPRFLYRVAANTVRGKQAFFPIYFTHYDSAYYCYKTTDCRPPMDSREENMGFWRSFSYGVASMYKSDLLKCGGFRTNITGWGIEDVDLYEKCLNTSMSLMRVVDPSIYHRYHIRECDKSLPESQLTSCLTSGAKMLGSVKVLKRVLDDMDGALEDT